jgi:NADH-quinone oxidoreductase subunit L
MFKYIWLVPLLPLIGAAINGLLGRKLRFSEQIIGGIAVGSVALAFLISVAAVYSYGFGGHAEWPKPYLTSQDGFSFDWIPGGAVSVNHGAQYALLNIEWSYQLDPLSSIFMLIVTGVGLCIFVFATGYMHGETGFYRFFAYMGLFMFAMLVLVMGSNFLMMFVGWEGVGLCSYLLIGYYFDRQEAANASRKAFITNRVGDFGFALAIFGIIATFGSAQYYKRLRTGEELSDRANRSLGRPLVDRARTLYRRLRKVCATAAARVAA